MRGKVTYLGIAVLAFLGRPAMARIGDKPQAIAQRYGVPITNETFGDFTRCAYQKDGYAITIFYQNGVSVMETFASRGLDQNGARTVVTHIAECQIGSPAPDEEGKIREASGITSQNEVFWTWTSGNQSFDAAFNPVECTLVIFSQPSVYAGIHQALINTPLPGA
jgi:hypothetical protein